jgi:endonuclease-3
VAAKKEPARASADTRLRLLRRRLGAAIPAPRCELDHQDAWQLLVATILSAQSTDRRVNLVTPELFRLYPSPAALAEAPRGEVERVVKSTGFFRNKAKAIQEASRVLVEEHGGLVPRDINALVLLPGVARKTANVVLGTAYRVPSGIPVDTHAARVAERLELSAERDPEKIERDLCALFPKRSWVDTGHRLILHGRYVCTARAPRCAQCPLAELCPARDDEPQGTWTARARWEAARVAARGAE